MNTATIEPPLSAPAAPAAPIPTPETEWALGVLARDGYCLMKGIIPADEVGAVRESVGDTVRKHSSLPPPQGYVTGFLRLNQSYAPYLAHPRLMTVMDRLF